MKNLLTIILLLVLFCPAKGQTANNSIPAYAGTFRYGMNPGYWGTQFTNPQTGQLAANAGCNSLRIYLPDYYSTPSSGTAFNNDFTGYAADGMSNNVAFVGGVYPSNRLDSILPTANAPSWVWRNLYTPIYSDSINGIIDTANRFAVYIDSLVMNAKNTVNFYEIINESDFTYNTLAAGGMDNFNVTNEKAHSGSWWNVAPADSDLPNLQASVFYYIRMMKIAYTVIHRIQPNAYVCTGGIGYPSSLDCYLRYTDNPVDGSVNAQFPLTGGAYFDCISFHTYPFYNLQIWSNTACPGGCFVNYRYSDRFIDVDTIIFHQFDSVQVAHGYNGTTYPKKIYINTETDASEDSLHGSVWGSMNSAINYTIKWNVVAQSLGIKQADKYALGGNPTDYSSPFNNCGLYGDLTPSTTTVANAPKTQEFYGYKTMTTLLKGKSYDPVKTAAMNIPNTIRGYAFNDGAGNYTYVMWAKTSIDLSEGANASYTFPFAFSGTRMEWDYSSTNATAAATQTVALTGNPSFFVAGTASVSSPVTNAGTASGTVGTAFSYSITASNTPASYAATGLPAGLTVNTSTGVISGTPTTAGTSTVTISATNAGGTGTNTLTITINPAKPVISSAGTASGTAGTAFSYSITASNTPTSYAATGLPAGVTVNTSTGAISGTPTAAGTSTVTISATNAGGTGTNTLHIIVSVLPVNTSPTANAGTNQIITLPINTVTLSGSGTDANGTIVSYQWLQVSGPSSATISSATSASTSVTNLVQGVYQFSLTVTDNNGATGTTTEQVIVNVAPIANAGTNHVITLPANSVTLSGSGVDVDGTVVSYQWTKLSGPSSGSITNATSAVTTFTGLVQGVYQLMLTVTDNDGATGTATVQVTVNASITPPVANAGPDQVITLPTNSVILNGSGTDANSTIVSYQWMQLSGPSTGIITNTNTASTTITGLVEGVYQFILTVTDNSGVTGKDTVQVTIDAARIAPVSSKVVANAGSNQVITLPANSATLNGSATDTGGTITSYQWTELSGPAAGTITNASAASTTVTGLAAGIYTFELTVTDNLGSSGTGTISVTANAIDKEKVLDSTFNVNVYPNPVQSTLTATISSSGIGQEFAITITDVSGRPLYKNKAIATGTITTLQIDVSAFISGVYFIHTQSATNSITKKIIKGS